MAMKKVGKVGHVPGLGEQRPPMAAIGPLTVTAQGAILKDDDRLMFAVHVTDDGEKPITGLTGQHFKVWRLGQFLTDMSNIVVEELENIPGLEGVYHLVSPQWSTMGNGTIPFFIGVARNHANTGTALTSIVKVREGLDT